MANTPDINEVKDLGPMATALFSKRSDGHVEQISQVNAAQLLGSIVKRDVGREEINARVPVSKLRELDLNLELWDTLATRHDDGAQRSYDLKNELACEFIAQLESVSGKTWEELHTLKQTTSASRTGQQK